jgi:hypothetical protein
MIKVRHIPTQATFEVDERNYSSVKVSTKAVHPAIDYNVPLALNALRRDLEPVTPEMLLGYLSSWMDNESLNKWEIVED